MRVGSHPEYSLEGLLLRLKLQYFVHLMWKVDSLEKALMLGKIEGKRRRGHKRIRWLDSITDSMGINFSKLQEIMKESKAWLAAIHGVAKSRAGLSEWMTIYLYSVAQELLSFIYFWDVFICSLILDMFLTEMCVQMIFKLHRVWTAQAHLCMDFFQISVFKNCADICNNLKNLQMIRIA